VITVTRHNCTVRGYNSTSGIPKTEGNELSDVQNIGSLMYIPGIPSPSLTLYLGRERDGLEELLCPSTKPNLIFPSGAQEIQLDFNVWCLVLPHWFHLIAAAVRFQAINIK
jgi:hypothetical protein